MGTPNPTPRPPRRRPRFGLRALFVVVTLTACAAAWLGTQVRRCRHENEAIAHLSKTEDGRGVTLLFANPFTTPKDSPGGPGMPAARFKGGPTWLTNVLGVDIFRAAVLFGCAPPGNSFSWDRDESDRLLFKYEFKTGLTDDDMQWLNQLHYLRVVYLGANRITDAGLMKLDNLPYVEALLLGNTAITDQGLPTLLKFRRLRFLSLQATNISDAAIDVLSKCKQLEKLEVGMTNITPAGLHSLQQELPNCKIEGWNH